MKQLYNIKTLFQSVCEFGNLNLSIMDEGMRRILKSMN